MNQRKFQKKAVGWLVLCSFVFVLNNGSMPLRGEKAAGNPNEAAAAAPDSGDELEPGMVEKPAESGKQVEKKKFPWLLVAAGAVVVAGVVIYFTLIYKPKYALTVTVGEGVSGTPAAGSVEYKKGTAVTYDFSADAGYKKVAVTLDGASVNASGTVTMDKAHTLAATATEGIDEQFTSSASYLWGPWHSGFWSVGSGYYKCNSTTVMGWEYNIYNYRFSSNQFVYEVKLRRTQGPTAIANGIGLFTSTNGANTSGYLFVHAAAGTFWVLKYTNYNFQTFTGTLDWIVSSTSSAAIHTGLDQWNTIRISRSGSNYTMAINGSNVYTFSDSTHDARYVSLAGGCLGAPNAWDYDYVTATKGTTLHAPPTITLAPIPLAPVDIYESLTGHKKQQ
jgi:hypothetical protein